MHSSEFWMSQALSLAEKGRGRVHPNPMVGCLVVRNNRIVGRGWHPAFGEPHAEIHALRAAGSRARGATLYVTLEPCSHWGKTPPCIDAIIQAGIKTVVASMLDPNPLVAGKGFKALRKAGVSVQVGSLQEEAKLLNVGFLRWISDKRPYIKLKTAASLDGKVATATGKSKWITGSEARSLAHQLRAQSDAIAVGIRTVLADNPSLSSHGKGNNPRRVIFDSELRTPLRAKVVREGSIFLASDRALKSRRMRLERKGATVMTFPGKRPALRKALEYLGSIGIANLLVEGGPMLHTAFLEADVVDEVYWFIAPILLGGKKAKSALIGHGVTDLSKALRLNRLQVWNVGEDLCVYGALKD